MRAIVLAAGRGSRMQAAEGDTPKPLYRIGNETALERLVTQIVSAGVNDVTVVLGYQVERVGTVLKRRFGTSISFVVNEHYATDTNIGSLLVGVGDRSDPFVVFEADCVFVSDSMERIFDSAMASKSAWYTIGRFKPGQIGAILDTDDCGVVTDVRYLRAYETRFAHYRKLIGVFKVGPEHVGPYLKLAREAAQLSMAQYYFEPFIAELKRMTSYEVSLEGEGVGSYNTVAELDELRQAHALREEMPLG